MNIMKLLSGSSTMNIRAFMCKLGRQLGNKKEESKRYSFFRQVRVPKLFFFILKLEVIFESESRAG